jgi:hypothetical protein
MEHSRHQRAQNTMAARHDDSVLRANNGRIHFAQQQFVYASELERILLARLRQEGVQVPEEKKLLTKRDLQK